jgi:hypothetical protein
MGWGLDSMMLRSEAFRRRVFEQCLGPKWIGIKWENVRKCQKKGGKRLWNYLQFSDVLIFFALSRVLCSAWWMSWPKLSSAQSGTSVGIFVVRFSGRTTSSFVLPNGSVLPTNQVFVGGPASTAGSSAVVEDWDLQRFMHSWPLETIISHGYFGVRMFGSAKYWYCSFKSGQFSVNASTASTYLNHHKEASPKKVGHNFKISPKISQQPEGPRCERSRPPVEPQELLQPYPELRWTLELNALTEAAGVSEMWMRKTTEWELFHWKNT